MIIDYKKQTKICELRMKTDSSYLPLLLDCYLNTGKTTKAERLVSRYLSERSEDKAFMFLAAKTFIVNRKYEKAEETLESLLESGHKNVKIFQLLSTLALEQGDRSKYLKYSAEIKRLDPFFSGLKRINDILEEKFSFKSELILDNKEIKEKTIQNDLRTPVDFSDKGKADKGILFKEDSKAINEKSPQDNEDIPQELEEENHFVRNKEVPEGGFNFEHLKEEEGSNNNHFVRTRKMPEGGFKFDHLTENQDKSNLETKEVFEPLEEKKEFDDSFVEDTYFQEKQSEKFPERDLELAELMNDDKTEEKEEEFNDSFVEETHYKNKLQKISAFIESQEVNEDLADKLRKEIEDEELLESSKEDLLKESNPLVDLNPELKERVKNIIPSIPTDSGINKNNILRAFEDIDLVEEERVLTRIDSGDHNNKKETLNDTKSGILIDNEDSFKTKIVDKVLEGEEKPRKKNIKIATSTLGEIYSSQGEYQKAKETYLNLLKQYPDNLDFRKKYLEAEFKAGASRLKEEIDYYKELTEKYPDNESYQKRFKQFNKEYSNLETEFKEKIKKITEE